MPKQKDKPKKLDKVSEKHVFEALSEDLTTLMNLQDGIAELVEGIKDYCLDKGLAVAEKTSRLGMAQYKALRTPGEIVGALATSKFDDLGFGTFQMKGKEDAEIGRASLRKEATGAQLSDLKKLFDARNKKQELAKWANGEAEGKLVKAVGRFKESCVKGAITESVLNEVHRNLVREMEKGKSNKQNITKALDAVDTILGDTLASSLSNEQKKEFLIRAVQFYPVQKVEQKVAADRAPVSPPKAAAPASPQVTVTPHTPPAKPQEPTPPTMAAPPAEKSAVLSGELEAPETPAAPLIHHARTKMAGTRKHQTKAVDWTTEGPVRKQPAGAKASAEQAKPEKHQRQRRQAVFGPTTNMVQDEMIRRMRREREEQDAREDMPTKAPPPPVPRKAPPPPVKSIDDIFAEFDQEHQKYADKAKAIQTEWKEREEEQRAIRQAVEDWQGPQKQQAQQVMKNAKHGILDRAKDAERLALEAGFKKDPEEAVRDAKAEAGRKARQDAMQKRIQSDFLSKYSTGTVRKAYHDMRKTSTAKSVAAFFGHHGKDSRKHQLNELEGALHRLQQQPNQKSAEELKRILFDIVHEIKHEEHKQKGGFHLGKSALEKLCTNMLDSLTKIFPAPVPEKKSPMFKDIVGLPPEEKHAEKPHKPKGGKHK